MKRANYAFKVMTSQIRAVERNLKSMRQNADERALHRLRVNTRRLRNSVSLFKPLFPKIIVAEWRLELSCIIRATSKLRDLDVYINFLNAYAKTLLIPSEKHAILGAVKDLKGKRAQVHKKTKKLIRHIEASRLFTRMKERLNVTVKHYKGPDVDMHAFAKERVLSRVKDVLDYDEYVTRSECSQQLHKLRIKNKHLRYTLEELKGLYTDRMEPFIERLRAFHDLLGQIHDYDVWIKRINGLLAELIGKNEREILGKLKSYCRNARNRDYQDFVIQWHRARQDCFFEEMLEYIYAF